jgi:hypothetical protein
MQAIKSANKRPNRVDQPTPKIREAIKLMVWEGKPFDEAAASAGLTTRQMRLALEKPSVLALLKREKQVLRESVSARNILRLGEIRDAADNMPAIQAIRTLEGMGEDQDGGSQRASASPGVTIRIVNVLPAGHADVGQPVTIDHETPLTIPADSHQRAPGGKNR